MPERDQSPQVRIVSAPAAAYWAGRFGRSVDDVIRASHAVGADPRQVAERLGIRWSDAFERS